MTTRNYYHHAKTQEQINPGYGRNHMFKVPFRMLIIGGSGSGKTNTLLGIIEQMSGTFCKIILCIANPDEPLYNLLKDKLKDKLQIYTGEIPSGRKGVQPNIPKIEDVSEEDDKGYKPTLIIFDDLCLYDNQDRISQYYIRGRKQNISMAYLSQSYFKIPITIRRQADAIILKRNVSEADLKRIKTNTSIDISFPDFCKLYRQSTMSMSDFMYINGEMGKIFKNFELTPLFSTYGDSKIDEDQGDFKEDTKQEYDYNEYKQKTTILQGINAFMDALERSYPNVVIPLQDLYDMYQQFAESNNYNSSQLRYFSNQLTKVYPKTKNNSTGIVSFYIER
jgi:hypothetical protein